MVSLHYKSYVGPVENYDRISAMQFNLLTFLGLRQYHFLLDIGCGSLRGGKLFIPYLLPKHYFGIEPERWLIEEGIKNEVGQDLIEIKQPVFHNDDNFTLSTFNQKFDFLLAQSIFSHASQQQIKRCLSEAKKVMKPNSIFAATFMKGNQDYTGEEWVYPDCITYTLERMINLTGEQDLVCKLINWPHPNQQSWLLLVSPEGEGQFPSISDIADLSSMDSELRYYKEQLTKIESHPYVKFGLWIYRFMRRVNLVK